MILRAQSVAVVGGVVVANGCIENGMTVQPVIKVQPDNLLPFVPYITKRVLKWNKFSIASFKLNK